MQRSSYEEHLVFLLQDFQVDIEDIRTEFEATFKDAYSDNRFYASIWAGLGAVLSDLKQFKEEVRNGTTQ